VDLARIPWAIWDPITDRDRKAQSPVRMTVHTAWVNAPDIYGPRRGQGNTYAHVYNPTRGALRQHQELNRMSRADLHGNGQTVSVENQDERREMPFSDSQLDNMARLFALLVTAPGSKVPNRIATVNDTRGLAWHRLGIKGNFGRFDPNDMTTWCGTQTGERWSDAFGKLCPTNARIRQIPEIYARAQKYISGAEFGVGGITIPKEDDDMAKAIEFSSKGVDGNDHLYVAFPNAREYDHIESKAELADYANILIRQGFQYETWKNAAGNSNVDNPDVFGRYVGPESVRPAGAKRKD